MSEKYFRFVNKVWIDFLKFGGLEATLLDNLKLVNCQKGNIQLSMELQQKHLNRLGRLHGGTIAAIVDLGGSLSIASHGFFATGVSSDLNVTYMKSGGMKGDTIQINCTCDKYGKTLGFTKVEFYDDHKNIFARGSHTKYLARAYDHVSRLEKEVLLIKIN